MLAGLVGAVLNTACTSGTCTDGLEEDGVTTTDAPKRQGATRPERSDDRSPTAPDQSGASPLAAQGWSGLLDAERRALRHAGAVPWTLVAAAVVAVGLPFKMLRVAHGDTTTALAILDAASKTTVVTGVLVQLLPSAVLVAWGWCWVFAAVQLGRIAAVTRARGAMAGDADARRALLRFAAVSVPGALLAWMVAAAAPWPAAVGTAVMAAGVCAVAYGTARRGRDDQDGPGRLPRALDGRPVAVAIVAAATVGALTLAVADLVLTGPMSDDIWLPPLAVETAGGTSVVYVLRDDGDSRIVLHNVPRRVAVLRDDEVSGERFCSRAGLTDRRSLWDVSNGSDRGGTPPCP